MVSKGEMGRRICIHCFHLENQHYLYIHHFKNSCIIFLCFSVTELYLFPCVRKAALECETQEDNSASRKHFSMKALHENKMPCMLEYPLPTFTAKFLYLRSECKNIDSLLQKDLFNPSPDIISTDRIFNTQGDKTVAIYFFKESVVSELVQKHQNI